MKLRILGQIGSSIPQATPSLEDAARTTRILAKIRSKILTIHKDFWPDRAQYPGANRNRSGVVRACVRECVPQGGRRFPGLWIRSDQNPTCIVRALDQIWAKAWGRACVRECVQKRGGDFMDSGPDLIKNPYA